MANQSSYVKHLQEEDEAATKRNADLLSSLPKERGHISFYLYNYQGCWLTASRVQSVLAFQKHFQPKDSDVFLVTPPKCGTTWLKALVFATKNRTHHFVRSPDHPLLVRNPHELVPYMELQIYAKNENPDLSCFGSPRLFSTHLPYVSLPQSIKDSKCRLVCLCRNPKDTFISSWHFTKKLNPSLETSLDEAFERFCTGVTHLGPYWDHVLGYWEKSIEMSGKIIVIKYEDLKDQPLLCLKKLADFLGCPFSLEEETSGVPDQILRLCSFDALSNLEVNKNGKWSNGIENQAFFRHGQTGDSKNFLTDEMIKRLDGLAEDKFKPSGLQF